MPRACFESGSSGRRTCDNGVLLLVVVGDRKVRIEVGYGLEGDLTDATAGTIIRSEITPRFKDGDFDAGVLEGAAAIVGALEGTYAPSSRPVSLLKRIGFSLVFGLLVPPLLLVLTIYSGTSGIVGDILSATLRHVRLPLALRCVVERVRRLERRHGGTDGTADRDRLRDHQPTRGALRRYRRDSQASASEERGLRRRPKIRTTLCGCRRDVVHVPAPVEQQQQLQWWRRIVRRRWRVRELVASSRTTYVPHPRGRLQDLDAEQRLVDVAQEECAYRPPCTRRPEGPGASEAASPSDVAFRTQARGRRAPCPPWPRPTRRPDGPPHPAIVRAAVPSRGERRSLPGSGPAR